MNKSPEEYFAEQDFSVRNENASAFSPAEKAFMDKYLGISAPDVLAQIGISPEGAADGAAQRPDSTGSTAPPASDVHAEMAAEEPLDNILKNSPQLLMVGFFIGSQEFVVPTVVVQEVIRAVPAAKLPAAPALVAGVINLRGKVTPLVHLRDVLEVNAERQGEDKFIIICRRQGIQVGLVIERVHTMYNVPQQDIEWGVEGHIGANVDFVAGLLKLGDRLVSVVSVDRVIASILK